MAYRTLNGTHAHLELDADAPAAERAKALGRRFGFYTFPVALPSERKKGKEPLIKDWEKRATIDGSLFDQHPDANIGVAIGRSGHVVLDVDSAEGEKALRELFGGQIPETLTVSTGRDGTGRHYYFELPEGHDVRGRNGIAPGLDLKAAGGYVVAPPSLHASGNRYTFDDPTASIARLTEKQVEALVVTAGPRGQLLSSEELERRCAPGEGKERIGYVREVLEKIPNDAAFDAREDWIGMGHRIKVALGEGYEEKAFELFDEWSKRWEGNGPKSYDAQHTRETFESLGPSRSGGFRPLLSLAEQHGYEPSARLIQAMHEKRVREAQDEFEADLDLAAVTHAKQEPHFTETGTSPPAFDKWRLKVQEIQGPLKEVQNILPELSPEERKIAEAALVETLKDDIGRKAADRLVRRTLHPNDRDPFTADGVLRSLELTSLELDVPYLVPGLIPAASVGLLVAPHSLGKSFLAISLALSVAFGKPWFGRKPTESGPTLFILAEGQRQFPIRMAGWLSEHNLLSERFTPRELSDALRDRAMIAEYPLRLDDPRLVDGLIRTIRAQGTRLVVMDTLGRLLGNEQSDNENETANAVMRDLLDVAAETGATILVIHHTGYESTSRARGASAWEQAADFVYLVKGDADDFGKGQAVTLVNTKMKDDERARSEAFALRKLSLELGDDLRKSAVVEQATAATEKTVPDTVSVFRAIRDNPGLNARRLREAVPFGKRKADAARDRLLNMEAIENRGHASHHEYHVAPGWSISPDGRSIVPGNGVEAEDEFQPDQPVPDLSDLIGEEVDQ